MAKKVEAIMTGHRKVDRRLKKLAGPDAKKMIRRSSKDAIKPIHQQAKGNAKQNKKSGQLTKGYKSRAMPRSRVRFGSRVTIESKSFPDEFYASFQELGWKSGLQKKKNPGRQDLKKAAEAKRKQAIRQYHQNLKAGVKALARS